MIQNNLNTFLHINISYQTAEKILKRKQTAEKILKRKQFQPYFGRSIN